jgi:hypothetical protein
MISDDQNVGRSFRTSTQSRAKLWLKIAAAEVRQEERREKARGRKI